MTTGGMTMTSKFQTKKSIELADIFRTHIVDYQEKYPLYPEQYKIIFDLPLLSTSDGAKLPLTGI